MGLVAATSATANKLSTPASLVRPTPLATSLGAVALLSAQAAGRRRPVPTAGASGRGRDQYRSARPSWLRCAQRTWSIAPGSQAGYRVGEVLAGQDSTAVGRTNVVTGSMNIKGTSVESGSFTADMRAMNYAADVEHRDLAVIARDFLATR